MSLPDKGMEIWQLLWAGNYKERLLLEKRMTSRWCVLIPSFFSANYALQETASISGKTNQRDIKVRVSTTKTGGSKRVNPKNSSIFLRVWKTD